MPDTTTIQATIATLTAAGLDVNSSTVRGVACVVVTDRQTGERYIHRDLAPWVALVRAATAAGFDLLYRAILERIGRFAALSPRAAPL